MKNLFQFLSSLVLVFSLFPLGQSEAQVNEAAQQKMETHFLISKIATLAYDVELRKQLDVVDDQADKLKELAKNHQTDTMKFYTDNTELITKLQGPPEKKELSTAESWQTSSIKRKLSLRRPTWID